MNFRMPMLVCAGGALLASAVGCGSSTSPTEPSSTTAVTVEHGAFAQCLGEHGVTEPVGTPAGPQPGPATAPAGVDPDAWDQAMQACSSLAPGPAGP
ncbi:hypothetical protein BH09ACT7_BH09ACT7_03270 [soil metagenome]